MALESRTCAQGKLQLAMHLMLNDKDKMKICRQIGVTHAITFPGFWNTNRDEYDAAARKLRDDFAKFGFTVAGIEGFPILFEKAKLGLEGRDVEILNMNAAIAAFGKAGINMICYDFMAELGWYRTKFDALERGGALTSEFSRKDADKQGLTERGEVSEDEMWENITYFLERIIPVAEKYNVKMGLHPDDPPISPLRGLGRICKSAEDYRRILNITPSPVHGITFCQANFKAMGVDIYELAREFCEQGKVFFVHYRDIEGNSNHFYETFHDNGPTDMAKMLEIYVQSGFIGPIRPDHAPTMEGESSDSMGYGTTGKVFAFGYMKGLMDSMNLPYE